MSTNDEQIIKTLQEWNRRTLPPEIIALAEAAQKRHDGVAAVLFYGSWLRSGRVDEGIADLYLLVDQYQRAFGSRLQAFLNHLLPPNVFYLELPYGGLTLRAKYAVLTMDDFQQGARNWFHSYIWGRFSQPSGVVYVRNEKDATQITEVLLQALRTFVRRTLPQLPDVFTIRELWGTGLSLSYRCELRSEKPNAAVRLYDAAPDYYEAVTDQLLHDPNFAVEPLGADVSRFPRYRTHLSPWDRKVNSFAWFLRRIQGKILSALRLLKALLTFENGLQYIQWKIERHSGVRIEVSPSLQKFPLLAVCVTFWRLFLKGGFR